MMATVSFESQDGAHHVREIEFNKDFWAYLYYMERDEAFTVLSYSVPSVVHGHYIP